MDEVPWQYEYSLEDLGRLQFANNNETMKLNEGQIWRLKSSDNEVNESIAKCMRIIEVAKKSHAS